VLEFQEAAMNLSVPLILICGRVPVYLSLE
jgi:hypothetical protein